MLSEHLQPFNPSHDKVKGAKLLFINNSTCLFSFTAVSKIQHVIGQSRAQETLHQFIKMSALKIFLCPEGDFFLKFFLFFLFCFYLFIYFFEEMVIKYYEGVEDINRIMLSKCFHQRHILTNFCCLILKKIFEILTQR